MRVIQKNVGEMPKVIELENELSAMQEIVGGYIETFPIDEGILVVCNEEGKLKGLPVNFAVQCSPTYIEYINGNVFICRAGNEDFESLTDEDITYWMNVMSNNV